MTRLTRLALEHLSITLLLMVILFVAGIVAARSLNQELIPDIEFPLATVVTVWPGASADEMTTSVTRPIEDALKQIKNVDVVQVSSTTSESFSAVTLRAQFGTTQDKLRDVINSQLTTVQLPDGAKSPEIILLNIGDLPIVSLSVSGNLDSATLQRLVDEQVVPDLEGVTGVAKVSVAGGRADKMFITLDPAKLAAYGLTVDAIQGILQANNVSIPAGTLTAPGEVIPLQVTNRISSADDLRRLVLRPAGAGAQAGGAAAAGTGAASAGASSGTSAPVGASAAGAAAGSTAAGAAPVGASGQPTTTVATAAPAAEPNAALPPLWTVLGATIPGDITPDMLQVALKQVPEAVTALTPGELLALPAETARALPASVLAAQPDDVRAALEALRAGGTPAAGVQAVPAGAITLGDVATVERAPEDATTVSRTNGQPALGVSVYKDKGENTVRVVDDVLAKITDLENEAVLKDVTFNVISEQGSYIKDSLSGVQREGLLGALFAILVILVFLSFSVRATLVTAISIPLSVVTALLLMRIQGLTLNLLTLSGLTIAIGRIVDDAIVVTENIFRHLQRGDRRLDAVIEGTREVTTAITASTLVTVAVFLPLGFIGGITKQFFLPFGLTASYALLASLLVAVTIVPLLARMLLSRSRVPEEHESWLQRLYTGILEGALGHRGLTLTLAFVFFLLSLGLLRFIPETFIPSFGKPTLTVSMALPPGTDLATTDAYARRVESVLSDDKDIETVQATVGGGGSGGFTQATGNDTASASFVASFRTVDQSFMDRLQNKNAIDPQTVADRIREALPDVAAGQPITFAVSAGGFEGMSSGTYDLQIRSNDEAKLREANALILAALKDPANWKTDNGIFARNTDNTNRKVPIINLDSNLSAARPVLSVEVDPAKALAHGLTTAQVALMLRNVIAGTSLGDISVSGDGQAQTLEVIARYPADQITSVQALTDYQISGPAGPVRLGDIATVTQRPGSVQISRVDGERAAIISGEITRKDTFGVTAEAQQIVDDLGLDDRFGTDVLTVGAGVESSQQQQGFSDMLVALLISIVIVYAIMVITFRSLIHPFSILFSLPFAFSGAFIALAITGRPLSISSLIGLLMLVGIVVTNAIVLVDLVQQHRKRGMDAREALIRGGRTRLRPILMTATATVLALVPQALELSGKGTLIASDLATVVIGGLLTSTVLTLIVVPVVYSLLDRLSSHGAALVAGDPGDVPPGGDVPPVAPPPAWAPPAPAPTGTT